MSFADLLPLANHLWQSTLFVAVPIRHQRLPVNGNDVLEKLRVVHARCARVFAQNLPALPQFAFRIRAFDFKRIDPDSAIGERRKNRLRDAGRARDQRVAQVEQRERDVFHLKSFRFPATLGVRATSFISNPFAFRAARCTRRRRRWTVPARSRPPRASCSTPPPPRPRTCSAPARAWCCKAPRRAPGG